MLSGESRYTWGILCIFSIISALLLIVALSIYWLTTLGYPLITSVAGPIPWTITFPVLLVKITVATVLEIIFSTLVLFRGLEVYCFSRDYITCNIDRVVKHMIRSRALAMLEAVLLIAAYFILFNDYWRKLIGELSIEPGLADLFEYLGAYRTYLIIAITIIATLLVIWDEVIEMDRIEKEICLSSFESLIRSELKGIDQVIGRTLIELAEGKCTSSPERCYEEICENIHGYSPTYCKREVSADRIVNIVNYGNIYYKCVAKAAKQLLEELKRTIHVAYDLSHINKLKPKREVPRKFLIFIVILIIAL